MVAGTVVETPLKILETKNSIASVRNGSNVKYVLEDKILRFPDNTSDSVPITRFTGNAARIVGVDNLSHVTRGHSGPFGLC